MYRQILLLLDSVASLATYRYTIEASVYVVFITL
ncbi:hypothetical protein FPSE_00439 [Fusarium pseudograminearum CS3096]|uniref:Uncharacterized protein n=1 Tax=Fusarium pseudograminearum (strain CS3096) TaxID=1028729 RepID=K3VU93_FUSPC|nr:hypothetical protein FPSE_00439 [Fusarium pseudograminearum CS3096]EKJ79397.1 hypothetical protein FPSE_00439 [Fusarium pseudograminearum CS3096]